MLFAKNHTKTLIACLFIFFSFSTLAVEVTPYFGKIYAGEINDMNGEELTIDDAESIGLGIAWNDGPNGQGQILITAASHDFDTTSDTKGKMDVVYAHFNGIAQFRQRNYVTTVSIGLGGAYYDVENGSDDLLPSLTAALGTKYKIDNNFSVVTELRGYATLTDDDSELFCQNGSCVAEFDGTLWIETSISVGVSYSF